MMSLQRAARLLVPAAGFQPASKPSAGAVLGARRSRLPGVKSNCRTPGFSGAVSHLAPFGRAFQIEIIRAAGNSGMAARTQKINDQLPWPRSFR